MKVVTLNSKSGNADKVIRKFFQEHPGIKIIAMSQVGSYTQ